MVVPADFIAFANTANPATDSGQDVHELFLGNFLAQDVYKRQVQALRSLSAYKSAGSGVSWSKIGGVKAGVVEPGGSIKPVTPEVPVPTVPTKNSTPAVMPTGSQRGDGSGDKQGGSGMQEVVASQNVDANKGESDKKSGSDESSGSKTTSAAAASRKGALDGRGGVNPVSYTHLDVYKRQV